MIDPSWKKIRQTVKECAYEQCPRNPKNPQAINPLPPILFPRREGTLDAIRCIVVSQEPGASLRSACAGDVSLMEEKLQENCSGRGWRGEKRATITGKGTSPVNMMIDLFGTFDLEADHVYWTHALKCIPTRDSHIGSHWKSCASCCVNHLKEEIDAIPAKEIAIIAVGRYAVSMCRHLLFGETLMVPNITTAIRESGEPKPIEYSSDTEKKSVYLTCFLHPANRNRNSDDTIEVKENSQKIFLRDFIRH